MKKFSLALLLCSLPSMASSFSFTGNFNQDDNLATFVFQLGSTSNVTLLTYGYAGGVNFAGTTVSNGGFDPILSIFSGIGPSAVLIGTNNDGGCSLVGQDSATSACWDSYLSLLSLPAGAYTVVLSQSDNSPGTTLGDPFSRAGQGNFTGPAFLGSAGSFIDANPSQRTAAWAVDINGVTSAIEESAVPEPATLVLSGCALGALALARRARSTRRSRQ